MDARNKVNQEANRSRIEFVDQAFGSSGEKLVKDGRILVGEGVLTKICRKKPKPRQFFLFNDILVYGNIVQQRKRYNQQKRIELQHVQVVSVPDSAELQNAWQIISPKKSFTVFSATPTEKNEWMDHIKACVKEYEKNNLDYATTTEGVLSPVWVQDKHAPNCSGCNSEFTITNRRHHCRKCGNVFCGSCSKYKIVLISQSQKPVRVCGNCYENSQKTSNGSSNSFPNHRNSSSSSSDDDDKRFSAIQRGQTSFYQEV